MKRDKRHAKPATTRKKAASGSRKRTSISAARLKTTQGVYFVDTPILPTVLIVDEDLAFVWWLGEILIKAGCTVIPALTCSDALSLVQGLRTKVDLILINPSMDGASEMIAKMNDVRTLVKLAESTGPRA